jgi:Tfp pilus assembly protein FimT
MTRHRAGFTTAELIVVIVIMAIVMAIGVPRFTQQTTGTDVRAARDEVAAYLATARAAAIQRGRDARFTLKADTIAVERDQGGGVWVSVRQPISLAKAYSVSVASNPSISQVTYNSRGTAKALAAKQAIVVTKNSKKDSVCVSKFGMIMRKGCL